MIDYDVCIGCRMCVAICPFGAMSFDALAQKVIKCDFCDGDPLCASFCDVKAIRYADTSVQSIDKQVAVADKFTGILQKAAAAMATV
jgi:Fe-S-cluster-containing hydrogenase component 2